MLSVDDIQRPMCFTLNTFISSYNLSRTSQFIYSSSGSSSSATYQRVSTM